MEALSIPHLLIILVIVLVFFGGRRIPDVMKGLGQGIREFKDGMRGGPDTSVHPNPVGTFRDAARRSPIADRRKEVARCVFLRERCSGFREPAV